MSDEKIESIIRRVLLNQYIFSKVAFTNAKDTAELLAVSDENTKLVIELLRYKVYDYQNEIIAKWAEEQS